MRRSPSRRAGAHILRNARAECFATTHCARTIPARSASSPQGRKIQTRNLYPLRMACVCIAQREISLGHSFGLIRGNPADHRPRLQDGLGALDEGHRGSRKPAANPRYQARTVTHSTPQAICARLRDIIPALRGQGCRAGKRADGKRALAIRRCCDPGNFSCKTVGAGFCTSDQRHQAGRSFPRLMTVSDPSGPVTVIVPADAKA